ncbi:hypothetical protein [Desulfotalea psychrophila]|uniref:hypothetical protein n=1 Tax=Desulfotalea psychrophila TaxID=84980 RepID=UPI00059DF67D|nr:hypothetical protein [Desulfotalea psychrophila]
MKYQHLLRSVSERPVKQVGMQGMGLQDNIQHLKEGIFNRFFMSRDGRYGAVTGMPGSGYAHDSAQPNMVKWLRPGGWQLSMDTNESLRLFFSPFS